MEHVSELFLDVMESIVFIGALLCLILYVRYGTLYAGRANERLKQGTSIYENVSEESANTDSVIHGHSVVEEIMSADLENDVTKYYVDGSCLNYMTCNGLPLMEYCQKVDNIYFSNGIVSRDSDYDKTVQLYSDGETRDIYYTRR